MRPPVIVTTVGHSGSSALMEILHRCGMFVGEVRKTEEKNYWENIHIQNYNVRWIMKAGVDRARELQLPETYVPQVTEEEAGDLRERIYVEMRRQGLGEDQVWGWKDPRTVMTFDNWRKIFPDAKWVFLDRRFQDVLLDKYTYGAVPGLLEFWRGRFQRNYDILKGEEKCLIHYDQPWLIRDEFAWLELSPENLTQALDAVWQPKYDGVYT